MKTFCVSSVSNTSWLLATSEIVLLLQFKLFLIIFKCIYVSFFPFFFLYIYKKIFVISEYETLICIGVNKSILFLEQELRLLISPLHFWKF